MSKWEEKRLGELAKVVSGYAFSSVDFNNIAGVPVIKIANIGNGTIEFDSTTQYVSEGFLDSLDKKYIVKTGDVLISLTGSHITQPNSMVGRTAMYRKKSEALLNQRAGKIVGIKNKGIDTFIYYNLRTQWIREYIGVIAHGAANQANISPKSIESIKTLIPPLSTQQKIADILSTYDDLIDNNNRRIELLEKAAQGLYKEWFVRMHFPGHKKVKFENGMPQGWEVVKLGDEINITSSKRVFLSDYVERGIPFYRSKEVIQLANGRSITEPLFIDEQKYLDFKSKFGTPVKNDILLTSVGTIGIAIMISDDKPFYFKDGNLTWLQSNLKPDFAFYLYLWLNSNLGKQQILSSVIGTSQSALTIENLKKNKIIKPSNQTLADFAGVARPIFSQINNLHSQNRNLIKQRDLLLPRLMSGKLEVQG